MKKKYKVTIEEIAVRDVLYIVEAETPEEAMAGYGLGERAAEGDWKIFDTELIEDETEEAE